MSHMRGRLVQDGGAQANVPGADTGILKWGDLT